MIPGIDYLGLGHKLFPVKDALSLTPAGYAIGFFDTTFGDVLANLRPFLQSNKFPAYRVHIGWSDNHKMIPLDQLRRRLAIYQALALEDPKVKIYLSYHCEANEHDRAQVQKRVQLVRKLAPKCIPVNSNIAGVLIPSVINEFHDSEHAHQRPYIASQDGEGNGGGDWVLDQHAWNKLHSRAEINFHWIPEFNGRTGGQPAPPPLQRKKFATAEDIRQVVSYTKL